MSQKKRITLPGATHTAGGVPIALRLLGSGKELPLPADVREFALGSDPANYLVLDDRYASAMHCVLARRGKTGLVVMDRGSKNGTKVNGARIRGECEVGPGARITIGETTMVVVGSRPADRSAAEELVGEDAAFRAAVEMVVRTATLSPSSLVILVRGESGTGKELVARLVHEASSRAEGPFVAVNCGAIAPNLVEAELFGHERGSFTGATVRRRGMFEQAHGGTLFLDEIGELPLDQQPRLLRVLETRRLRRVGAQEEITLDVRVVAATHRDLRAAAERGEFRVDLYHRLASVEVRLPPLRERPSDIGALARKFVADLEVELGPRIISPATLAALQEHSWPGNARELRNALYRAALGSLGELRPKDIMAHVMPAGPSEGERARAGERVARYESVDDMIRDVVRDALARHGSVRKAAEAIRMPKSTFYDHVQRLGLGARRVSSDTP